MCGVGSKHFALLSFARVKGSLLPQCIYPLAQLGGMWGPVTGRSCCPMSVCWVSMPVPCVNCCCSLLSTDALGECLHSRFAKGWSCALVRQHRVVVKHLMHRCDRCHRQVCQHAQAAAGVARFATAGGALHNCSLM
jgi:hypothetical protein